MLVAWEAWALAARERAETGVKSRISSVKKRLKKAYKQLNKHIRYLEDEIRRARSLIEEGGWSAPHKSIRDMMALRSSLEKHLEEGSELLEDVLDALRALERMWVRLDALLGEARTEALVGSLDRAHELVVEAEGMGDEMFMELSRFSSLLEEKERALASLRIRLEELLRQVECEMGLVDKAGVRLRGGELIHLAWACRAKGLGKGVFIITDERAIFYSPSRGEKLELKRGWVRAVSISRAFLGLRKRLVLLFSGPCGRGELILLCDKKDAKDILAELPGEARGGHEAQAGGLHAGRGGADSHGSPDDRIT